MKNNFARLYKLILLFSLLIFTSCYGSWNITCNGNDVAVRADKMLKLSDADQTFADSGISSLSGKYDVLIFSDVHFGTRREPKDLPEEFYCWLDSVKGSEKAPAFAICLGDIAEVGAQSDFDEYLEFCDKLKNEYGIKLILNVCGNHDIYQNHWDNWKSNCYPYTSFYKFETSAFSWYVFDTASGVVGSHQYEILRSEMENDDRPKIMLTHYPLSTFRPQGAGLCDTAERNILIRDFAQSKVLCYFAGHNHRTGHSYFGFDDYLCPSLRYNKGWYILHVDEEAGLAQASLLE